jgi:hypothetical protein
MPPCVQTIMTIQSITFIIGPFWESPAHHGHPTFIQKYIAKAIINLVLVFLGIFVYSQSDNHPSIGKCRKNVDHP